MIKVGVDLIEIERIEKSIKRERFLHRVLGENEYAQLKTKNFCAQSVAACFCAKEAFLKSIGKGLFFYNLSEIELLRSKSGEPFLNLIGSALLYKKENNLKFAVSVSHSKRYATATVICYN